MPTNRLFLKGEGIGALHVELGDRQQGIAGKEGRISRVRTLSPPPQAMALVQREEEEIARRHEAEEQAASPSKAGGKRKAATPSKGTPGKR